MKKTSKLAHNNVLVQVFIFIRGDLVSGIVF